MQTKMPRWSKDDIIGAEQLNALAEGIERAEAVDVDGGSGLQLIRSPGGKRISFAGLLHLCYVQLVGVLPKGDGGKSLGHGQGKILQFEGSEGTGNGTLSVPDDTPTRDVYSLLDTALKDGATIMAVEIGPDLHYLWTVCKSAVGS